MQSAPVSAVVLAGLLLFGVKPPAVECMERCGCIPPESRSLTFEQGVAESLRRATVVFRGQVVRADAAPSGVPGVIRKAVGSPTGVARLVVSAAWKGEVGDTVTMTLRSATSCDWWMREGEEYVVFATRLQDGSLYTRHCTGTVRIERADSTIAALGAPIRHSAP